MIKLKKWQDRIIISAWILITPLAVASSAPENAQQQNSVDSPQQQNSVSVPDWNWDEITATPPGNTPSIPKNAVLISSREVPPAADLTRPAYPVEPLFPGKTPFAIIPSIRDPALHPCSTCHAWTTVNPAPRKLAAPHERINLQHGLSGKTQFWCLTCHRLEGPGGLRTITDIALSFDESYLLCSQCHGPQGRDWQSGAHGKRVANWDGPRQLLTCTTCHNPHHPAIPARSPAPPPPLR